MLTPMRAPAPLVFSAADAPAWARTLGADTAALPETLRAAVEADDLGTADIVLIDWATDHAPIIGALCERLRAPRRLVGAICPTRGEVALALVTGADCAWHGAPDAHELAATLLAHRRTDDALRAAPPAAPDAVGPIHVDDRRKCITVSGHQLPLSPRLYDLLAYLVANPGRTVSRDDLLGNVWGLDFDPETNVVDVYVHYLRRALRPHALDRSLVTVRGRGYRLDLDAA